MLQSKEVFEDGTIVGFWKIEESLQNMLDELSDKESLAKLLQNFNSEKRCLEYVAVRLLLKSILNKEKQIAYNKNGSPFLIDKSYNIGITHSGEYVGVILNATRKVGIDVEKIKEKIVRVKDKYLSKEELSFVDKNNSKLHLTLMWCVKEAIYKIVDDQFSDIINQIKISPFSPYIEGTVEAQEEITRQKDKFILNYKVEPDLCKVWVVK